MKIAATLLLLVLVLVLPATAGSRRAEAQVGAATEGSPAARGSEHPEIEAVAWALADAESGRYLAGNNADEQLPIGSVTKIVSALVVLEEGTDLDEEVMISKEARSTWGTSTVTSGS